MEKDNSSIIGIGNEDKLLVQKSLPLLGLWKSNLTLREFKILDAYLGRINSDNPNRRMVVFQKGELEKLLGVDRIRKSELDKSLYNLMSPIKASYDDAPNGILYAHLFSLAYAKQSEDGTWQVILKCSEEAEKYFFKITNIGYLQYRLKCIKGINSRYSYIMFIYIEKNRFRQKWDISLDDLRQILKCEKNNYTKEYKKFNEKILKKVQKELLEKTECHYSYSPIKKGRKVIGIHFEVDEVKSLENTDIPEYIPPVTEGIAEEINAEIINAEGLVLEALEPLKLKKEQIEEINSILVTVPDSLLPQNGACDSMEINRFHYLDQKVREIIRRDKQKTIRSKFAYLKKMIEKEINS